MSIIEPLMHEGVKDGVFPYGEWILFDKRGILESGATQGSGGRWFDLASLTKLYTATAVLEMAKQGLLSLDARVSEFLNIQNEALRARLDAITLHMLLTHTSGLPAWYPFYADGRPFFDILAELPYEKGMVYSDIGYMLLREVLCTVSGLSFEKVIDQYATKPLGIDELSFCPSPELSLVPSCRDNAIEENMCRERGMHFDGFRPHHTDVIGETNDGNAFYYFGEVSGHAGLFGTCASLAKLGQFYLNTEDAAFLGAVVPQKGCSGRCLVFHTGGPFPTGCGHTGFTGTSLWIDREAGMGLVILTNRLYYDHLPQANMNTFRIKVHEALLNRLYEEDALKKSA